MITPEKILLLEQAAEAAVNRKEMRCQVAMADLYKEAGLLPGDLEIPNGPRDWAQAQGNSLIKEWLKACPYFVEVEGPALPGDLLCFRLGHIPHHVSLQLGGGRMAHVFGEHGVLIAPCVPLPWARRLDSIWRLK